MLRLFPVTFWKWLLRLVVGLAIIAVLISWKGAGVQAALSQASWCSLAVAVALYLTTQLISAWKWKILLDAALKGAALPDIEAKSALRSTPANEVEPDYKQIIVPNLAECFRFYLIGMFCNLWLPTSVGGDAVRAALAGKRWGNLSIAVSSILVERITGLLALLVIGAIGWLFWQSQNMNAAKSGVVSGSGNPLLYPALSVLLAIGVLVSLLLALRKLAFHLESRSSSRLIGKWAKIHRALDIFASPGLRPALIKALLFSLIFQSTQVGLNIFLAKSIGLELQPLVFFWLVPSLSIASMIPLGIGGLGVREGAAVSLLQGALALHQMPAPATILAWSLLWQATLWLSGLPGAVSYLTQKERTP